MSGLLILFLAIASYCVIGAFTGLALTIQRRGIRYIPDSVLIATMVVWPVLWIAFVIAYFRRFFGEL
ncbi:hypothetical protein [Saccharibacter sp. EH60]|uniref:hypothetical protein n=1 Tax=Saccharibacter sp. EH60 TaxID=2689390 RepID=UPI0013523B08|nr:hypothetical protein [Saccharibacter sp. EH60]MXV58053.1 hypothetical protein [Saccharibacter sp. EH70]